MKRIPELRKLSEDHHHGLVLARRARLAGSGTEGFSVPRVWEEVEKKFRYELEPHFQIEEEYIAPPLKAMGEIELIKRFNDDHRILREIISNQSDRSPLTLKKFGEMLERHIRFEECELFEIAQKRLSPDVLKLVEKACQKFRGFV